MGEEDYDLLVIGGGINGAGVARDAAGRGLKVILCEKDDLASHTSSASTKLIHGGLRYLENYDFMLVRHALKEREVLLANAPHIIWPLRFVLPHHKDLRPRWLLRLGLFLYDHIGGRKKLPKSHGVNLANHPSGAALKTKYRSGFEYSDCWVQDARLVVLNALDAAQRGAHISPHTLCTELKRGADGWQATLSSKLHNTDRQIKAKAVVNAAGPWVEKARQLYDKGVAERTVRLAKGSHIVVPRLFDHSYCYIFQNSDGRILFAIPYEQDYTLLGTTDLDYQGNVDDVAISHKEITYICKAMSEYIAMPIKPDDVLWSYSGVRALFDDNSGNVSKVSREYELELDTRQAPIVNIYGGKITTYRKLSEEVMQLLKEPLGFSKDSWTANAALPGGDIKHTDFNGFMAQTVQRYAWLDQAVVVDWCRNYGTQIDILIGSRKDMLALGKHFGGHLYEAEVEYLINYEWARSSDDIIWRRSKKGLKMQPAQVQDLDEWLRHYFAKQANSKVTNHH